MEAGLERLAGGGIDMVLLDLGLPDSDGLPTFDRVRQAAPALPIIVLSTADNEPIALKAIQQGAQDYLVKSTCTAQSLIRALQFGHLRTLSARLHPQNASLESRPRVIGIIGAKGGVGATTLACVLADELRAQADKPVFLTELDSDRGSVGFLMGTNSEYSLSQVIKNRERLDSTLWAAMVKSNGSGLDILSCPGGAVEIDPSGKSMEQVISFAGQIYKWMVLDLGRWHSLSAGVLPQLTDMILVTTPSIPALFEAKRVIDVLTTHDTERERLRLIINQSGRADTLDNCELEKLFGIRVFARIADDSEAIQSALLRKQLPSRESRIRQEVKRMAGTFAGTEPAKPKSRTVIPQIFSLFKSKTAPPPAVELRD